MSKTIYIIIFLSILLLIYLSINLIIFKPSTPKSITQKIKDQNFSLEIADTPYLLSKGLSNRSELCPNCGMLFIFGSESTQSFWMKNTLIPLDMIFINASGQVTEIFTATPEPGKNDFNLSIYQAPAKYIIELNAGTAAKIGLKPGDFLDLNL